VAEPITPEQLAVIRTQAYTTAERREFVFVDEITKALGVSVGERARCSDPVECGHEAALGQAQAEVERLTAELGTAKAVMYRALKDGVDHEEVLFLIRRYLDVYPGATTAFPSTAEEGEG